MLTTVQRLWRTSMVIAAVAIGTFCVATTPAAAAANRIQLSSVGIDSNGAALVVRASYLCAGQGSPFGTVFVTQNVGSGRIQSQFDYVDVPRCSPGKRVTFSAPLTPPTQDDNPGDPQFVANAPWRMAPVIVTISVNNSGLNRVATPTAATTASPSIQPTGRILAQGAGVSLDLIITCGRQAKPAAGYLAVQLTQVIRGVAQTMNNYANVLCDGKPHHSQTSVANLATPWQSGPAFVTLSESINSFADVRLGS